MDRRTMFKAGMPAVDTLPVLNGEAVATETLERKRAGIGDITVDLTADGRIPARSAA